MESAEKSAGRASACADLESILKDLDSLFDCMDQLALRTQLRECDLITCVGHPDKLVFLKRAQEAAQQPAARPATDE